MSPELFYAAGTVIIMLLGYVIWQLQRAQTRFDALIAGDHVHKANYDQTVSRLFQRIDALAAEVYTLRGEFDAHRTSEEKKAR